MLQNMVYVCMDLSLTKAPYYTQYSFMFSKCTLLYEMGYVFCENRKLYSSPPQREEEYTFIYL